MVTRWYRHLPRSQFFEGLRFLYYCACWIEHARWRTGCCDARGICLQSRQVVSSILGCQLTGCGCIKVGTDCSFAQCGGTVRDRPILSKTVRSIFSQGCSITDRSAVRCAVCLCLIEEYLCLYIQCMSQKHCLLMGGAVTVEIDAGGGAVRSALF